MLHILIILTLIIGHGVNAGRGRATYVVEIDETLAEVNSVISKASSGILNQYRSQTTEILQVIEELNNLHEATMPLILLLLNDTSSCQNYLMVRRTEMDNVTQSIAQSKYHLQIDVPMEVSTLEWKSTQNATKHLESLSDRLFDISMELLEKTKSSFTRTINDLIVTKTLESEALTSKDVNIYMEKLNVRITRIERSVERTIAINSQFSKAKKEEQLKIVSEIQNVNHELKYSTHLNCSMVAIDDENPYIDYINQQDVHDLFKALSETQRDIEQILNDPTFDSLNRAFIDGLQTRVEKAIEDIENYYLLQRAKEKELQHQITEALNSDNHTSLESIDYEFLRDINDVRNFINRIYEFKNKSLKDTLPYAHKIFYFPGTIAGIEQAVINDLEASKFHDDSIGFTMRQIEEAMRKRFALAFNENNTYGDVATMYLYNVYELKDYYARELLMYALKNLRRSRFIQATEKYWMADIELYLNSHLQLIIHSECDDNLYETLGHGVQDRVLRKILAYVKVLRLLKPGDLSTMAKTSVLVEMVQKYRYQSVDSRSTAGRHCGYYKRKMNLFDHLKGRTRVIDDDALSGVLKPIITSGIDTGDTVVTGKGKHVDSVEVEETTLSASAMKAANLGDLPPELPENFSNWVNETSVMKLTTPKVTDTILTTENVVTTVVA